MALDNTHVFTLIDGQEISIGVVEGHHKQVFGRYHPLSKM
jgi:hypothetical protein